MYSPAFQETLYNLARELVKPCINEYNRDINLTLCEIENYIGNREEIEYNHLVEQLYVDIFCYFVNGQHVCDI